MLISFKNRRVLGSVAFSLLTACVLPQLSPARALAADPAKALETPAKPTTKMPSPTNVTPAEAEALLHSHKQLLVIDVRTQEEFAEGHINGARNVNFNSPTFLERMKEFEGKSILVHCAGEAEAPAPWKHSQTHPSPKSIISTKASTAGLRQANPSQQSNASREVARFRAPHYIS